MCLYQALPHAKIPLVPTNGNSSTETTTGSPGASAVLHLIATGLLAISYLNTNHLNS